MDRIVIKNCPITKRTSFLKTPYIGNIHDKMYKKYKGFHTGVDIEGKEIYTICPGVCTLVGKNDDEGDVVIIQYDRNTSFRYCNLLSVSATMGSIVLPDQQIGIADKFVHFELLTRQVSDWVVRVGKEVHYKQDPTDYAYGNIPFDMLCEYLAEYDVDPMLQTIF